MVRDLYLVRHGEAAAGADDDARPLTAAGRATVARLGRTLAGPLAGVRAVRHSGLRRARETAEILARALDAPGAAAVPGLRPSDDPGLVAAGLIEEHDGPLVLVGHLPHLERLTGLLVAGDADHQVALFEPATAAALRRDGRAFRLRWLLAPGLLGGD